MSVDLRLLKLRSAGMFSNVNEVVEQIRLAKSANYTFAIDWLASCYSDPERKGDPWTYYFEPCFEVPAGIDYSLMQAVPGGIRVACTRENIITPRLDDGNCNPLLLPRDRLAAHQIIERYITPRPNVMAGIDEFFKLFQSQMIGLHIRGAGRVDGGVTELRSQVTENNQVPTERFFEQVDHTLRILPDAGIFACSDNSAVIDDVKRRYGDRVITWPAARSLFGEMHADHPANEGMTFSPYQLGLDVVSEAFLLSRTTIFVHGNSNVANFVLCKSPNLLSAYIPA